MTDWPSPNPLNPNVFGMLPPQEPVSIKEAEEHFSKAPVDELDGEALAADYPAGAPSIVEQARALRNNLNLIFQFVHDNIEVVQNYGSHKGAMGTLIDGCGNAFDQSDLMVELLRQAGYTANFVFGVIRLPQRSGPIGWG